MIKGFSAIVLAAGEGTRLAGGAPSPKPKVLYEIAGRPLIGYTLEILKKVGVGEIIIVVGYQADAVSKEVGSSYKFAAQGQQLGTGHALKTGFAKVSPGLNNVLVVNGDDSAFYKPETIQKVLSNHVGKGDA